MSSFLELATTTDCGGAHQMFPWCPCDDQCYKLIVLSIVSVAVSSERNTGPVRSDPSLLAEQSQSDYYGQWTLTGQQGFLTPTTSASTRTGSNV